MPHKDPAPMWLEAVRMAAEALARNRLRSLLTGLGILIGIAATIAMMSVGQGAAARVKGEIGRLGSDLLTVSISQSVRGGMSIGAKPFDYADIEALRRDVNGIRHSAPIASRPLRVVTRNVNWTATVLGTESAYFDAVGWRLAHGRPFTPTELYNGRPVCVLGTRVARQLFGRLDVVGEALRVATVPCTVIGVLTERGQAGRAEDGDNLVAMPFDTYQRRIQGSPDIQSIAIAAYPSADMDRLKMRVIGLLRERRHLALGVENDFAVLDMRQVAQSMASTARTFTLFLGSIAVISLVVGGIGIMNIMLVSVTERTREIGVRLALGAGPSDIRRQFLIEAVLLTSAGGIAGIVAGTAAAALIAPQFGVPWVVDPMVVIGAALTAVLVGIGFGYGPAATAARLDPATALRHDV
jgi:putative ABC transport system permease protein